MKYNKNMDALKFARKAIGKSIKEDRIKLFYTISELARKCDMSCNELYLIESGDEEGMFTESTIKLIDSTLREIEKESK